MGSRIETASCFCEAIAAELQGDPFWICYDHDDDCRRAIGSPLNIWVGYRPNQFRLVRGTPTSFSKTKGVVRTFCANCGTSISYLDEGLSDEIYVTIGFLDNPERFEPQAHAFWRMKLPWVGFADDLPRIDSYSRRRDPAQGNPADRQRDPAAAVLSPRARPSWSGLDFVAPPVPSLEGPARARPWGRPWRTSILDKILRVTYLIEMENSF